MKETGRGRVLFLKDPSYSWIWGQAWGCSPWLTSHFAATTSHDRRCVCRGGGIGISIFGLRDTCLCHSLCWVNVCGKIYGEWGRELGIKWPWEDGEPFCVGEWGVGNEVEHWEVEVGGNINSGVQDCLNNSAPLTTLFLWWLNWAPSMYRALCEV